MAPLLVALCFTPQCSSMSRHRNIGGWVAEAAEEFDDEDLYDYSEEQNGPLELYTLVVARSARASCDPGVHARPRLKSATSRQAARLGSCLKTFSPCHPSRTGQRLFFSPIVSLSCS